MNYPQRPSNQREHGRQVTNTLWYLHGLLAQKSSQYCKLAGYSVAFEKRIQMYYQSPGKEGAGEC